MTKRKKTTKKKIKRTKSSPILKYIVWILAIIALMLASLLIGYYVGINKTQTKTLTKKEKQQPVQKICDKIAKSPISVKKKLEEVLKKETPTYMVHKTDNESVMKPATVKQKKHIVCNNKPKLAIIIDDVNTASEVRAIKSLHIPVTMSFFPPRPARPNTPKLAAREKVYMVHLPLAAMHFASPEPHTLDIDDSQQKISARIRDIKRWFPRDVYINNHTGSKFTANEVATTRLIRALQANHIYFVDSRTTAKTAVPKVMKKFGLKYVARDVFLDDSRSVPEIITQIKRAIVVAKRKGHAIAIGHPHKNTLKALSESKQLFKDVDLVQINQIY